MNVESYSDLLEKMSDYMIANQTKITDFNDGSIIKTIFESIARIVERLYIDTRNGYSNSQKTIPYSVFDFKRKEGTQAVGQVVFSRTYAIDKITTIPTGTQVSSGDYIFYTTSPGSIQAGEVDSGNIDIQAAAVGIEYNVNANSITNIDSYLASDVVIVNNAQRCYGGTDNETETEFLARFKTYINGLQGTNPYGLKSNILKLDGVRSCGIVENFPPANGIYNFDVYIDDGTGNMNDTLKAEVEDVINGTDTAVQPGCRSTGVKARVAAASPKVVTVSCKCTIYQVEDATAIYEITQAITEEINSLGIGENIVLTSLILRLRRISYIKDVTNLLVDGSSENTIIATNQIARCGDINITLVNY